jgi:NIMA (never in mitosis gene a)-related kinase
MPLEAYEIIAKIGTGKYCSVYRVRRLADGVMLALKKVSLERMSRKERQNALNEVKLLSAIKHPHVVSLVEVFYDDFIESLW